jgi:hypothetical protein
VGEAAAEDGGEDRAVVPDLLDQGVEGGLEFVMYGTWGDSVLRHAIPGLYREIYLQRCVPKDVL